MKDWLRGREKRCSQSEGKSASKEREREMPHAISETIFALY